MIKIKMVKVIANKGVAFNAMVQQKEMSFLYIEKAKKFSSGIIINGTELRTATVEEMADLAQIWSLVYGNLGTAAIVLGQSKRMVTCGKRKGRRVDEVAMTTDELVVNDTIRMVRRGRGLL